MSYKTMHESYAQGKRQKEHRHKLAERYQTLMALIETHENVLHPDYDYIKDLCRRRDQVKTQMKYCGFL
jgi:hypothetical protein